MSRILQVKTLGIPMEDGRELLLETPGVLVKSDVEYLSLLEKYIALLKEQAEQSVMGIPRTDDGEDAR